MIASHVSRDVLKRAAQVVGVRADITTLSSSGQRHRVKLYPVVPSSAFTSKGRRKSGEKGDAPYQRESVGYGSAGRRVSAVCWHGFRDYFREVFSQTQGAHFYTSVSTWRGSEDFEARYRQSGYKNIGPPVRPVAMASACRCPESGYVR